MNLKKNFMIIIFIGEKCIFFVLMNWDVEVFVCSLVFLVVVVIVDVDVVVIFVRKINSWIILFGKFVIEGICFFLFFLRLYGMNVV